MPRTQPQALTTDELLNHAHSLNYNVSVDYVRELCDRFSAVLELVEMLDQAANVAEKDPRQLELPL